MPIQLEKSKERRNPQFFKFSNSIVGEKGLFWKALPALVRYKEKVDFEKALTFHSIFVPSSIVGKENGTGL